MNRSYHKRIFIRVSCDGWKSFVDYPAQHVVHMPEENIDLFTVKHQLTELTKLDGDITNVVEYAAYVRYDMNNSVSTCWSTESGDNHKVSKC